MTPSTRIDLLELITPVAILLAGAYLVYHIIRYVVILINRGIDEDIHAAHRQMGHHRYVGPDDAAHDEAYDGAHHDGLDNDSGQLGIDWLCRRARERRDRAARGGDGPDRRDRSSPIDNRSSIMAWVASPDGCPGGQRAVRSARPVVVVRGGAFAGARVRVLMESRGCPGLFFVEIMDGEARGLPAVISGELLS